MQELHQETYGKWIDPETGESRGGVIIHEGTEYETISLTFDPLGYTVKRIMVMGEQYDIIG